VKDSSFCEQKEAKKLYYLARVQGDKSFLVLFFKKEPLS
jgi:hypothetical protein